MTLPKTLRALAAIVGAVALALTLTSDDAVAKKKADSAEAGASEYKTIQETGVAEFDEVFMKAKTIHETLGSAETSLHSANDSVTDALGLPKGTPMADAMADLKEKAQGKLKVAMNDGKPTVETSDAVPDNVQAAIDATNSAVTSWTDTANGLTALPGQVNELISASKAFPSKAPSAATSSGLKATEVPKFVKKVKHNVAAIGETKPRLEGVSGELIANVETVKSLGAE